MYTRAHELQAGDVGGEAALKRCFRGAYGVSKTCRLEFCTFRGWILCSRKVDTTRKEKRKETKRKKSLLLKIVIYYFVKHLKCGRKVSIFEIESSQKAGELLVSHNTSTIVTDRTWQAPENLIQCISIVIF